METLEQFFMNDFTLNWGDLGCMWGWTPGQPFCMGKHARGPGTLLNFNILL